MASTALHHTDNVYWKLTSLTRGARVGGSCHYPIKHQVTKTHEISKWKYHLLWCLYYLGICHAIQSNVPPDKFQSDWTSANIKFKNLLLRAILNSLWSGDGYVYTSLNYVTLCWGQWVKHYVHASIIPLPINTGGVYNIVVAKIGKEMTIKIGPHWHNADQCIIIYLFI